MNELKNQWEKICNAYLKAFCEKHDISIYDSYWVGDRVGEVAEVGDYFVDMSEMRYDIDNDLPEETFFKWYDYSNEIEYIESDLRLSEHITSLRKINFESYSKGAPLPYSESELAELRMLAKRKRTKKGQTYPRMRSMSVGEEIQLPISVWSAARSAASTFKNDFGALYKVCKINDETIMVKRLQ